VTGSYRRIRIRFCKQRVPRPHRALTAPSAPRHTPRVPHHASDNRRFARPPLCSRAAGIKRPGTKQAGPDPIRPSARVFSATVTRSREYGCSRLFSARKHGRSRLSTPLLVRLGCSRPHSCLQSSGVLGSASAHRKARAFSALFLLTELGRSRLCLHYANSQVRARFESCASQLQIRKPCRPITTPRFARDGPPANHTVLPPSVTSRTRVRTGLSEYRASVPSRGPRTDTAHAFRKPVPSRSKRLRPSIRLVHNL